MAEVREVNPPTPVAGDSPLQTHALESGLAANRYHSWLASLALPYLGAQPIEFGSGLGNYAQWWLDKARVEIATLTLVERDPSRLKYLQRKFRRERRIEVTNLDILNAPETRCHSSMLAYNFLEHIESDALALRAAHRLCQPGAPVVMFVPAFPLAFGRFDKLVGHYRRYTKDSLRTAFIQAGLIPEEIRYVNAPGLITWFLAVRVLGMSPTRSSLLSLWDAIVVPITRRIESRVRPPFGQSVFGVARVPQRHFWGVSITPARKPASPI